MSADEIIQENEMENSKDAQLLPPLSDDYEMSKKVLMDISGETRSLSEIPVPSTRKQQSSIASEEMPVCSEKRPSESDDAASTRPKFEDPDNLLAQHLEDMESKIDKKTPPDTAKVVSNSGTKNKPNRLSLKFKQPTLRLRSLEHVSNDSVLADKMVCDAGRLDSESSEEESPLILDVVKPSFTGDLVQAKREAGCSGDSAANTICKEASDFPPPVTSPDKPDDSGLYHDPSLAAESQDGYSQDEEDSFPMDSQFPRGASSKPHKKRKKTSVYPTQIEVAHLLQERIELICKKRHDGKGLVDLYSDVDFRIYVPRSKHLIKQTSDRTALLADTFKDVFDKKIPYVQSFDKPAVRNLDSLKEKVKSSPKTLFIIVADEGHWGVVKGEKASHDMLINSWTSNLQNVIVVQVTATPFNLLSENSRIPKVQCFVNQETNSLELKENELDYVNCFDKELHIVEWAESQEFELKHLMKNGFCLMCLSKFNEWLTLTEDGDKYTLRCTSKKSLAAKFYYQQNELMISLGVTKINTSSLRFEGIQAKLQVLPVGMELLSLCGKCQDGREVFLYSPYEGKDSFSLQTLNIVKKKRLPTKCNRTFKIEPFEQKSTSYMSLNSVYNSLRDPSWKKHLLRKDENMQKQIGSLGKKKTVKLQKDIPSTSTSENIHDDQTAVSEEAVLAADYCWKILMCYSLKKSSSSSTLEDIFKKYWDLRDGLFSKMVSCLKKNKGKTISVASLENARSASLENARSASLENARSASLENARSASPENARSASPENARSASLENARSASPENAQSASPENARSASPENARSASLENARSASPENAQSASPENAQSASPENARSASPENARSASPENVRSASPENARSASLENARSASLENARSASPENARSVSPENARSASLENARSQRRKSKSDTGWSTDSATLYSLMTNNLEESQQSLDSISAEEHPTFVQNLMEHLKNIRDETLLIANTLLSKNNGKGNMIVVRLPKCPQDVLYNTLCETRDLLAQEDQTVDESYLFEVIKDHQKNKLSDAINDKENVQRLRLWSILMNVNCQKCPKSKVCREHFSDPKRPLVCSTCGHQHRSLNVVSYEDLDGLACVVIVVDKVRMGTTMPGNFKCFDLRLHHNTKGQGQSALIQELGRLCRYVSQKDRDQNHVPYALVGSKIFDTLETNIERCVSIYDKHFRIPQDAYLAKSGKKKANVADDGPSNLRSKAAKANRKCFDHSNEETSENRILLAAEPQVGKTGAYLCLIRNLGETIKRRKEKEFLGSLVSSDSDEDDKDEVHTAVDEAWRWKYPYWKFMKEQPALKQVYTDGKYVRRFGAFGYPDKPSRKHMLNVFREKHERTENKPTQRSYKDAIDVDLIQKHRIYSFEHFSDCSSCSASLSGVSVLKKSVRINEEKFDLSLPKQEPYSLIRLTETGLFTERLDELGDLHLKHWIFVPTYKRARKGVFNYKHAMSLKEALITYIHVLVVRKEEFNEYCRCWGKTHMILALNGSEQEVEEGGIGHARKFIQNFSIAIGLMNIFVLDDNIAFVEEVVEREGKICRTSKGYIETKPVPLGEVLLHYQNMSLDSTSVPPEALGDPSIELKEKDPSSCLEHPISRLSGNFSSYGVLGMLKSRPGSASVKLPFKKTHCHSFVLLNLKALKEHGVEYKALLAFEDLTFNIECDKKGLFVCKFNRYCMWKCNFRSNIVDTSRVGPSPDSEFLELQELMGQHQKYVGPGQALMVPMYGCMQDIECYPSLVELQRMAPLLSEKQGVNALYVLPRDAFHHLTVKFIQDHIMSICQEKKACILTVFIGDKLSTSLDFPSKLEEMLKDIEKEKRMTGNLKLFKSKEVQAFIVQLDKKS